MKTNSDFNELQKQREEDRIRNRAKTEKAQKLKDEKRKKIEELRKKAHKAAKNHNQKSFWKEHSENIIFGSVLGILVLFVVYAKFFGKGKGNTHLLVFEEDYFAQINESGKGFSVASNEYFKGMTIGDAKKLMNNGISRTKGIVRCPKSELQGEIKESFDFTKENAECHRGIFNSGKCSAAFAHSVVSTFSDRLCIQSVGADKFVASTQYPLSCETRRAKGT